MKGASGELGIVCFLAWWYFYGSAYMHVSVALSCLTLCDPMDCSLPGSSVHGIFQVRVLEWVALLSRGSSQPGIEPRSPALQMDSILSELPGKPHR